jgi:hypothetical protein
MALLGLTLVMLTSCLSSSGETSSGESSSSLESSSSETTLAVTPVTTTFDFDALNTLEYLYDVEEIGAISHIEGHGIAQGDYLVGPDTITILPNYLVGLAPGIYELTLMTTRGSAILSFDVIDLHNLNRVANASFETGDLFGWTARTIFKGEANLQSFTEEAIVPNGQALIGEVPYGADGNFLLARPGTIARTVYEERIGRLASRPFVLGGSGYITFMLGAGQEADLSHVSIKRAEDQVEVGRYGNSSFDVTSGLLSYYGENLVAYRADLSAQLGQSLYVELIDIGGHDWDYLTFDNVETYHASIPEGIDAIDIRPTFLSDIAPNQVPNGTFADLSYWSASSASGWNVPDNTFRADNGLLKSNQGGDASRGLIRSSLFRVDGSGFISMQLGAGQGSRFDKDTFVSIRHAGTNEELFRFANTRHDGSTMLAYYLDLSDYMNDSCYLEVLDNGSGSWDVLFIDNVITYYPDQPSVTYALMARNLNY